MVLILGIVYMLAVRFMLKTDNGDSARDGRKRSTFRDLIREYHLTGRARRLAIRPGSPMIGQRLDDLKLRERYCANVIGVERWRRFRRVIVNVNGVSEFRARDVLLIDMSASDVDLRQFCGEQMLESAAGISWYSICRLRSMTLRRPTARLRMRFSAWC